MPQSFLTRAGVSLDDFSGQTGFSGSHDTTIALVESGTYAIGALNSQVWEARVADGSVNLSKVEVIFTTPQYYDYHWVAQPDLDRFGDSFGQKVRDALTDLDRSEPEEAAILRFFGAERFIDTQNSNYDEIEAIARDIGKI
jgi:phosphonate transport system substrate-binding protein